MSSYDAIVQRKKRKEVKNKMVCKLFNIQFYTIYSWYETWFLFINVNVKRKIATNMMCPSNRSGQCDVRLRVPRRWRLYHVEAWLWLRQLACNQICNVQCMFMQNDCTHKMAVMGKRLMASTTTIRLAHNKENIVSHTISLQILPNLLDIF